MRCAYTVVPRALLGTNSKGEKVTLHSLWSRRQSTKYNEVPYIIQRAAEAAFSPEGQKQTGEQVAYYMENARVIREGLQRAGFTAFAGEHAPYVWLRTPDGMTSWDCFDQLLSKAHVVGTPGSGFGPSGEGYFRISAFNSRENVEEAIGRIGKTFHR
jgi:LL-diaminopimelate aminotransferase